MCPRAAADGIAASSPHVRAAIEQQFFEHFSVQVFAEMVDRLGLRIPGTALSPFYSPEKSYRLLEIEALVQPIPPAFALAQHHGVPTRLLDWPRNPHFAAFFAAEGALNGRGKQRKEAPHHPHVFRDSKRCGLHSGQERLFSFVQGANANYVARGEMVGVRETVAPESLNKLTLPCSHGHDFLRLLWSEGISIAHLKAAIDSVKVAMDHAFGTKSLLQNIDVAVPAASPVFGLNGRTPTNGKCRRLCESRLSRASETRRRGENIGANDFLPDVAVPQVFCRST